MIDLYDWLNSSKKMVDRFQILFKYNFKGWPTLIIAVDHIIKEIKINLYLIKILVTRLYTS